MYVAEGLFDIGITGRDWVEETGSDVVSLGELQVLEGDVATRSRWSWRSPATRRRNGRATCRRACGSPVEYPELTSRFFAAKGIDADVRLSYGATEAKIPDIADCIVDITETGRALRAAGLRIIDTILLSYTEVVANPAAHDDPAKRHAMDQLMTLLNGTLDARGKVLVKLNVDAEQLKAVLAVLPSMKSPTMSSSPAGGYAVETVVEKQTDQHAHPGAEGRRRHRHPRAADLQDRCRDELRWHGVDRRSTTSVGLGEITARRRHDVPVPLHRDRRRQPRHRRRRRGRVRPAGQARSLRGDATSRQRDERARSAHRRRDPLAARGRGGRPTATSPRTPATRSWPAWWAASWRRPTRTCRGGGWSTRVGRLVPGHEREQAALLRGEGVTVRRRAGARAPHRSVQFSATVAALICTNARRMLRQRVRIVAASGAEAVAEPLDQARRRRRSPAPASRRRGGVAPRWMAASSYSPITWLTTTARPAPRPAGRGPRSSARFCGVFAPTDIGVVSHAHPVRYRTYRRQLRRSGVAGRQHTPTRPHLRQLPCVRVTSTRAWPSWWRCLSAVFGGFARRTHRKGSTHCTGVISHSTAAATGAPVQRSHPRP